MQKVRASLKGDKRDREKGKMKGKAIEDATRKKKKISPKNIIEAFYVENACD